MLIVPAELVKKIDDNRGGMGQAEFIDFLIDSRLEEKPKGQAYVTKDELIAFEQDIKQLLKSTLDFFVGYGLELGKPSPRAEFEDLSKKLRGLEDDQVSEGEGGEARIKWK